MIYALLGFFGLILIGLWFIDGLFNRQMDERDRELQEYYDAIGKNTEADNAPADGDLDQRLRDKYGDR